MFTRLHISTVEKTMYGRVLINPDNQEMSNLIKSLNPSHGLLRMLRQKGQIFAWDGSKAVHSQIYKEMGMSGLCDSAILDSEQISTDDIKVLFEKGDPRHRSDLEDM